MAVSAPISSNIDINLAKFPDTAVPEPTYSELVQIYTAIRSLQVSILPQYTTAGRPAYKKGLLIYDTTLGKLVIGGLAAWEVVTSV